MSYKIKLFAGPPNQMENEINKWLSEHNIELVQVIPCLAMTSVPLQVKPVALLPGQGGVAQVQVQTIQAVTITIVYKEKTGAEE